MARKAQRPRTRRPDDGKARRKGCMYCRHDIVEVDYKEYQNLRVLTSEKGKIKARRTTGLCRRHQGQAAIAIKRAREVALLSYVGQ